MTRVRLSIMSEAKDQREPSMEEILASIRRIIAEDGDGAPAHPAEERQPPPPRAQEEDILELTEAVEEDGTVVSLTPGGARKPAAPVPTEPAPEPEAPSVIAEEPEPPAPEPEPPPPAARQPEPAIFAPPPRAAAPVDEPHIEPPPPAALPRVELPARREPAAPRSEPPPLETAESPASATDRLVSSATAAASVSALSQLADLGQRGQVGTQPLGDAGRTLEGLVRELLRPMLRDWLEANRPQLVDVVRPALKTWLDANLAQLVERLVREEIQRMARDAESR